MLDQDKRFILDGLRYGFPIIDSSDIVEAECNNHKSCFATRERRMATETAILREIREDNYIVTSCKPTIVSAIGSIPTPNSDDIRLIHDASRPFNKSLNSYANVESTHYTSIDKVCSLLKTNGYMAKVDLSRAYRHVPVSPDNYTVTGLKWKFTGSNCDTYMYDTKLCFGAAKAPGIFQRITESVTRMLKRRGFKSVCVYLDDFIIIGDTYDECKLAFDCLVRLLDSLGFSINWSKVVPPTQQLIFLGVLIDSVHCTLSIPDGKLNDLKKLNLKLG